MSFFPLVFFLVAFLVSFAFFVFAFFFAFGVLVVGLCVSALDEAHAHRVPVACSRSFARGEVVNDLPDCSLRAR